MDVVRYILAAIRSKIGGPFTVTFRVGAVPNEYSCVEVVEVDPSDPSIAEAGTRLSDPALGGEGVAACLAAFLEGVSWTREEISLADAADTFERGLREVFAPFSGTETAELVFHHGGSKADIWAQVVLLLPSGVRIETERHEPQESSGERSASSTKIILWTAAERAVEEARTRLKDEH